MRRILLLVAALAMLAACQGGAANPAGLPDWYNLQFQIVNFYQSRAWERGASCTVPEMSITRVDVVERTEEKLVLNVRYFWTDRANAPDWDDDFIAPRWNYCQGFSEREFIVSPRTGGGWAIQSMSGPQRG